jgi:hypothetical protein
MKRLTYFGPGFVSNDGKKSDREDGYRPEGTSNDKHFVGNM